MVVAMPRQVFHGFKKMVTKQARKPAPRRVNIKKAGTSACFGFTIIQIERFISRRWAEIAYVTFPSFGDDFYPEACHVLSFPDPKDNSEPLA